MLIRPGSRNQNVVQLFDDYLRFLLVVENTPDNMHRSHEWNRGFHGAIGLAGESGEVLQLFKKDLYGKNKPVNRADLVNELGDALWYWVVLLNAFNITFEELIEYNIQKLSERYAEKVKAEEVKGEYIQLNNPDNMELPKITTSQFIVDTVSTYLPEEEQEKLRTLIDRALGGEDVSSGVAIS